MELIGIGPIQFAHLGYALRNRYFLNAHGRSDAKAIVILCRYLPICLKGYFVKPCCQVGGGGHAHITCGSGEATKPSSVHRVEEGSPSDFLDHVAGGH